MKLQEGIKQLIAQFGETIITEQRLANLLADLVCYADFPAMKQIIKDCVKAGYGNKILNSFRKDPMNVQSEVIDWIQELVHEFNFKEDLVSYGFDCLLYGLGCLTNINEPLSKGYDPYDKDGNDILGNLNNKLASYKKQYLDLLDRLLVLPTDILRDAPGYYTAEGLNKLYMLESKIYVILQQLGETDFSWCEQQRLSKLLTCKKTKLEAVQKLLDTLKTKFTSLLSSDIIIPKKFFIKYSGYYSEKTLHELALLEEDIKVAYYNLNKQYDDWCNKEKTKSLIFSKVETSKVLTQIITKICIPSILIIVIAFTTTSYVNSSEAIANFEDAILMGDKSIAEGKYDKALLYYKEAQDKYDGSFRSGHYSSIAANHIDEGISKAVDEVSRLIEDGQLNAAKILINSLPSNIVDQKEVNHTKIKNIQSTLDSAISEGLENIISSISNNGGKLDPKGKMYLEELLKLKPNDYWLNFIKSKEK